ncbi:sugar nucleotide-binding protein, partial [Candidatus Gottesmanbacteria bacterium]|nr:sugar nucleotide-binding protein [Candidatus Gottesmanbacteria bacterium]
MKILIIGSSGLVGSRFVELHKNKDELLTPDHKELDITQENLDIKGVDVVINFAAYTNVGEGEKQRGNKNGECWRINVDGVKNLLGVLDTKSVHFIQISTDMIFSGASGPYEEDNLPEIDSNKLTWYGYSKAEAERLLDQQTAILRLIYPVRAKFAKKLDYLRKPLQSFDQKKLWPLFPDQQISICFIDEACVALEKIISQKLMGIFHSGSSNTATPFELVSYLLEKARNYKGKLETQLLDNFLKNSSSSPVRYPKFGGLKVEETEKKLGIKFSSWREIIDKLTE